MARISIAYAHPPSQPELGKPFAVLAQDEETAALEPVPQDVFALAQALGLPSQTFVGWIQANRRQLVPMGNLPVSDREWLRRFTAQGYVDTLSYGPVEERPGSAEQVAKAVAAELAGR